MGRRVDVSMGGWVDGKMDGWTRWIGIRVDGWMEGWGESGQH